MGHAAKHSLVFSATGRSEMRHNSRGKSFQAPQGFPLLMNLMEKDTNNSKAQESLCVRQKDPKATQSIVGAPHSPGLNC